MGGVRCVWGVGGGFWVVEVSVFCVDGVCLGGLGGLGGLPSPSATFGVGVGVGPATGGT